LSEIDDRNRQARRESGSEYAQMLELHRVLNIGSSGFEDFARTGEHGDDGRGGGIAHLPEGTDASIGVALGDRGAAFGTMPVEAQSRKDIPALFTKKIIILEAGRFHPEMSVWGIG
jgi:hypothetical protein